MGTMMRRVIGGMLFFLILLCSVTGWSGEKILKMSTTTSTQSSGLLDVLLPAFEKESTIQIKVIAKGTGAAIRDGKDGNVDVIFVHAKDRERAFVKEGYGIKRYPVMHNDFVILGPGSDPAKIAGEKDAAKAFAKIADAGALFISRGDDSGTHTKEQQLWEISGVSLTDVSRTIIKNGKNRKISSKQPESSSRWYYSIGQGMGKVITYADEKQGYTLADRGTYIKYKYGKTPAIDLVIVSEGDKDLANPYGIIPVNPKKHPHVQYEMAMEFIHWLTGPRGQEVISAYRLEGKQLFYPDSMQEQ